MFEGALLLLLAYLFFQRSSKPSSKLEKPLSERVRPNMLIFVDTGHGTFAAAGNAVNLLNRDVRFGCSETVACALEPSKQSSVPLPDWDPQGCKCAGAWRHTYSGRHLLSAQEVDELCEEWQPEPLCPPVTEAERAYEPPLISRCQNRLLHTPDWHRTYFCKRPTT